MSVICNVNKVSDPSSTTRAKQTVVFRRGNYMSATIEHKRNLIIHRKSSSLEQHSKALSQQTSIICMILLPLPFTCLRLVCFLGSVSYLHLKITPD